MMQGAVSSRPRGADRIADRLVDGLGQAMELADVEIDPAHLVLGRALGDQHHLGLDHAGIADEAAARLDDGLRNGVAKCLRSARKIALP